MSNSEPLPSEGSKQPYTLPISHTEHSSNHQEEPNNYSERPSIFCTGKHYSHFLQKLKKSSLKCT